MDQSTFKFYSDHAPQIADRYESVVSSLSLHFADSFITGSKVLDIGCGSGRDLAALYKQGYDCYGIDPVSNFIEIAQKKHPELSNRITGGHLPNLVIPFNGNFDGVLCSAVLMHIEIDQLQASALAIKSCLKKGGRLLYSVPSKRLDIDENNRDSNGRLFIPNQAKRLKSLFESLGFIEISTWINSDSMGRDAVEWVSVLMELRVE